MNAIGLYCIPIVICILACDVNCKLDFFCKDCAYPEGIEPTPASIRVFHFEACYDFLWKIPSLQYRDADELEYPTCDYLNETQYDAWKEMNFTTRYMSKSVVWKMEEDKHGKKCLMSLRITSKTWHINCQK